MTDENDKVVRDIGISRNILTSLPISISVFNIVPDLSMAVRAAVAASSAALKEAKEPRNEAIGVLTPASINTCKESKSYLCRILPNFFQTELP